MSDSHHTLDPFTSRETDGARGWDFKACWLRICMLGRPGVEGISQIHNAQDASGEEVEGVRRNARRRRAVSHANYLPI